MHCLLNSVYFTMCFSLLVFFAKRQKFNCLSINLFVCRGYFLPLVVLVVFEILVSTVTSIICHRAWENESQTPSALDALCKINCQYTDLKAALKTDQSALAKSYHTIGFMEGVSSIPSLLLEKSCSIVWRSHSIEL